MIMIDGGNSWSDEVYAAFSVSDAVNVPLGEIPNCGNGCGLYDILYSKIFILLLLHIF